ncbi:hypothetical protein L1049_028594 [Liquidambar formosana]|uniref:F-box domain-containing protein n=1 Tax=Liquidambar formosana TaxID=63359 RepID=A0AAP0N5N4_LIQFO
MEENLKRYRRGRMAMTLPDMPHDIVINILSRLPVKSLMRFRCVCKSWHALVSDPNFVDMHLNQTYANNKGYVLMSDDGDNFSFHCGETFVLHRRLEVPFKIPFERFMVEGYCNGLICLRYRRIPIYDSDMYLWNPSIRKFKVLPESKFRGRRSTPKLGKMFTVFGFCPQINDYRVV